MSTAAARPTPLLLAALLGLSACAAVGQTPAAAPPPPVELAPQGAAALFGGPRDPSKPSDPARADGAVHLGVPRAPDPEGPVVLVGQPMPALLSELQHNAGHLQRCWDRRSPGVKGGEITIHAHLDPQGLVLGQCLTEDTVGDAEIQRCANELIAMGRYPAGGAAPVDVVFSMRLGSAAAEAG
jgi:hypothetical protein